MEALTEVVAQGKARYSVQRVARRADRQARRFADRRQVRLEPPQYSMLWRGARAELIPALRGARHPADRLVAARAGRAHRQVQARGAAARRTARRDERRMNVFMDRAR